MCERVDHRWREAPEHFREWRMEEGGWSFEPEECHRAAKGRVMKMTADGNGSEGEEEMTSRKSFLSSTRNLNAVSS